MLDLVHLDRWPRLLSIQLWSETTQHCVGSVSLRGGIRGKLLIDGSVGRARSESRRCSRLFGQRAITQIALFAGRFGLPFVLLVRVSGIERRGDTEAVRASPSIESDFRPLP